jgi:glycosyltransferase involved in cell wall biosynthesis
MSCSGHGEAGRERISVVVPTRNERASIGRFLASLPDEVELIVCDASDDGTDQLVLRRRPRETRLVRTGESIAGARQAGAERSRGDILVFTDADVAFDPGYFDRLLALDDWDAVCGPKLSRDGYARYYRGVALAQRLTFALIGVAAASGSNMVLRRTALKRTGGFRADLTCNEDTELFLRAGRLGLRTRFDPELVVWAFDHRRLRRGVLRKSAHSLGRNMLLYLLCRRPALPRLLLHDWGYWDPATRRRFQAAGAERP